jgi:hypothetical protein
VKLIEGVFDANEKEAIIEKLTDAMVSVEGEAMPSVSLSTELTAQDSALTDSRAPGSQRSRWACRPVRSLPAAR